MYLSVTLLTFFWLAVRVAALPAFMPIIGDDDPLVFVSTFVETINAVGEVILDDTQQVILKSKCEASGGADAYKLAKTAGFELVQCVQKIVNITVLQQEIAEKKATGDLEEVFPKYCERKNEFKDCFKTFVRASQVCFEEKDLLQRKIVDDIINKIVDFACVKDGDRIAMFIADKGPQCIEKNYQAINDCVNKTYGSYSGIIPFNPLDEISGLTNFKDFPSFTFDKKNCLKMNELQRCTLSALETCEEPTTANIADAIFNYIRKSTPCNKLSDPLTRCRRWRHLLQRRSPAESLADL